MLSSILIDGNQKHLLASIILIGNQNKMHSIDSSYQKKWQSFILVTGIQN